MQSKRIMAEANRQVDEWEKKGVIARQGWSKGPYPEKPVCIVCGTEIPQGYLEKKQIWRRRMYCDEHYKKGQRYNVIPPAERQEVCPGCKHQNIFHDAEGRCSICQNSRVIPLARSLSFSCRTFPLSKSLI